MSNQDKKVISRDFKGIWISRDIWLNKDLSIHAKALWAEIDSLYSDDHKGCHASNDYLSEFLQVKMSRLKEVLKELSDKGYLELVKFDGRQIIRKAVMPNRGHQLAGKPDTSTIRQPENRLARGRNSGQQVLKPHILIENKEENKEPPYPQGVFSEKSKKIAFREQVFLTQSQHEKLLNDYGQKKIDWMMDVLNNYKCSKGVSYKSDYHTLIGWVHKRYEEEFKTVSKEKAKHREGTKMAFESEPDTWKPKYINKGTKESIGDSNGME